MLLNWYTTAACLFEAVEDAGDSEVRRGAAPDSADRRHGRHDLDRLGAVRDVSEGQSSSDQVQILVTG